MIVSGDPITLDQVAKIIIRTDNLLFACNSWFQRRSLHDVSNLVSENCDRNQLYLSNIDKFNASKHSYRV